MIKTMKMKKKEPEQHNEGTAYAKERQKSQLKNDYIRNTINGRYYLERANMLAEQIISGNIKEKIDCNIKTLGYIKAEYALVKMQAIISLRSAFFSKQDLQKIYDFKDEDFADLEEDYYNGKIVREDYDESYKRKGKAEFVNTSKD